MRRIIHLLSLVAVIAVPAVGWFAANWSGGTTGAPDALFGVFVALNTLSSVSWALPQWEPQRPPVWLSRMLNRVPNDGHPGQSFEESWAKDRDAETARRDKNEQPWVRGAR